MSERKPYQSGLSDEQWALIEPVPTAWKNRHRSVSGHQGRYPMREIVNSILNQSRTGCQWALNSCAAKCGRGAGGAGRPPGSPRSGWRPRQDSNLRPSA